MSKVSTDPIADMLTRVRNAMAVNKSSVSMPHSKTKEAVARLLKDSGFISDVAVKDDQIGKLLTIMVTGNSETPKITEIVRLSKPGRRLYAGFKEIPVVKGGRGIVILSTSKGIMTGNEAKSLKLGGELICKVY